MTAIAPEVEAIEHLDFAPRCDHPCHTCTGHTHKPWHDGPAYVMVRELTPCGCPKLGVSMLCRKAWEHLREGVICPRCLRAFPRSRWLELVEVIG